MSLARLHRDRILAAQNAAAVHDHGAAHVPGADPLPASGATTASPVERASAQIALRLTHDLRRLKEIKSIDLKVAAKRSMLPEYAAWVAGTLEADTGVGTGTAAEVLPTCMVWLIDIGSYADALDLVPFVLKHKVAMPARYNRDAATIIVEEIAEAALRAQASGARFETQILYRTAMLTGGIDMHDEVRAKLLKAIGVELLQDAEDMEASAAAREPIETALDYLRRAQLLNARIGVKDRIKRAEKLLAANVAAFPAQSDTPDTEQNNEQGGDDAA